MKAQTRIALLLLLPAVSLAQVPVDDSGKVIGSYESQADTASVGEDGIPTPVQVEVGAISEAFTEVISEDIVEGNQLMVVINQNTNLFGGGGFGMMGGMHKIPDGGGGKPPEK